MKPIRLTYAEFPPGEVESITGFNMDTQRTWRKRKLLGSCRGVTEVASLMVRKALLPHSVSPADTRPFGDERAPDVIYWALLLTRGAVEVHGPVDRVSEFFERAIESTGPVTERGLTDKVAAELAGISSKEGPYSFLMSFEGEPPVPEKNAAGEIEKIANGVKDIVDGYFVSLQALGLRLGHRAQRPLVTLYLGPEMPVERSAKHNQTLKQIVRRA